MGLHSLLITNQQGRLLLSRYFDEHVHEAGAAATAAAVGLAEGQEVAGFPAVARLGGGVMRDRAQAMRTAESEVLRQTRHLWHSGTGACPQVARAKGDRIVAFGALGALMLFVSGSGEYDELTLCEVLRSLASMIATLCTEAKGHRVSEDALLTGNTYSKVCLAIDEMVPGGMLESLDCEAVLAATKFRTPGAK